MSSLVALISPCLRGCGAINMAFPTLQFQTDGVYDARSRTPSET